MSSPRQHCNLLASQFFLCFFCTFFVVVLTVYISRSRFSLFWHSLSFVCHGLSLPWHSLYLPWQGLCLDTVCLWLDTVSLPWHCLSLPWHSGFALIQVVFACKSVTTWSTLNHFRTLVWGCCGGLCSRVVPSHQLQVGTVLTKLTVWVFRGFEPSCLIFTNTLVGICVLLFVPDWVSVRTWWLCVLSRFSPVFMSALI